MVTRVLLHKKIKMQQLTLVDAEDVMGETREAIGGKFHLSVLCVHSMLDEGCLGVHN